MKVYADTTAGGFHDIVWYGNSVYNCDILGGGLDGNGFAKLSGIYADFKVPYSKIEVDCINKDSDDPLYLSIVPNGFSAAYAVGNKDAVMSQPYVRTCIVTPESAVEAVTNQMLTTKIKGVRNLDDEGFKGGAATAPTHLWYWHIVLSNNSAQALNAEIRIRVTYFVDWSELTAFVQ